jgi:hypothetical protein
MKNIKSSVWLMPYILYDFSEPFFISDPLGLGRTVILTDEGNSIRFRPKLAEIDANLGIDNAYPLLV